MRGLVVCVVLCAGCDGVFGLTHVAPSSGDGGVPLDARIDAPRDAAVDAPRDAGCGTATGMMITKHFGARTGGVVASGAHDTFVSSDTTTINHTALNFGGLDKLFACYHCNCQIDCESVSGTDDDVVALLSFDFGTEIPACSKIVGATLSIDTTTDNLGSGSSVIVYPVLEGWNEGTGLATGSPGTANWNQRVAATAWTDPGVGPLGSRGAQIGSFAPLLASTSYTVPIDTPTVQKWADQPSSNHGMVLVVTGSTSDVHFWSREYTDATRRPALNVAYMPP